MTARTVTRVARDLQAAANRLELANRNRNRDTILAGLYAGNVKGRNAAARLEAQAPALKALEAEVAGYREELRSMLDRVNPAAPVPPPFEIEPPTKRSKR